MSESIETMQFQWKLVTDPTLIAKAAVAISKSEGFDGEISGDIYSFPISECKKYLADRLSRALYQETFDVLGGAIINSETIERKDSHTRKVNQDWENYEDRQRGDIQKDRQKPIDLIDASEINVDGILNEALRSAQIDWDVVELQTGHDKTMLVIERKQLEKAGFSFNKSEGTATPPTPKAM